jgi:diacylglycerol kinase family enzyme
MKLEEHFNQGIPSIEELTQRRLSSAICCGMTNDIQPKSIGVDSARRIAMSVPRLDPASALLFVINAAAGALDVEAKRAVIQSALAAHGRKGELLTCLPADLARVATEAAAAAVARNTAVIAVGGDGSLNTVAQAAHAAGCAMGVIPFGTFNYFARTHNIPTEPSAAARQVLQARPMPVQVGSINDRVFLVNASLGIYPELLQDREAFKARFGRSRWVAFVAACATLLRAQRRLGLHIEMGTAVRDVQTLTLFVGNNRLQLQQFGAEPEDTLPGTPGDGSLAALMLRPIGTLSMLGLMLHGAMGRLGEAAGVEGFEFQHMVVKPTLSAGHKEVVVAFDGEVARMRAPIDIRVLDKPLYLLQATGEASSADAPKAVV